MKEIQNRNLTASEEHSEIALFGSKKTSPTSPRLEV